MLIAQIPGKLDVVWCPDVKAVWDQWFDQGVTLSEFKNALIVKGCDFAKRNKAVAWIADASKSKGVFGQEIQDFIASTVFKTYASIGIKYFVSIRPASAISTLGVKRYESQVGPAGIRLVDVASIHAAKSFLNQPA